LEQVIGAFEIASPALRKAAEAIAIGQSIGNPNVRLQNETDEMWERFGSHVLEIEPAGTSRARVEISFPVGNFTTGNLTHLLTVVMGGQMDIDIIHECRLIDLKLPLSILSQYQGPRHGVAGIRSYLCAHDRPLVGGIVKPKTGVTPEKLRDVIVEMADGGIDFIKEDEILGDIDYCPFDQRVPMIVKALEPYKIIYAPCVADSIARFDHVTRVLKDSGAVAFHYNFWGGLDAFKVLADKTGLFAFYQKSGDKVATTGKYSIDFAVWCTLLRLAGADFTHAGMIGGYMDEGPDVMKRRLHHLQGELNGTQAVMPSLSCGAHPGLVEKLAFMLGKDIMVSAGGFLHGHPGGTRAGAKAFRDAAEKRQSAELDAAVAKWGRG